MHQMPTQQSLKRPKLQIAPKDVADTIGSTLVHVFTELIAAMNIVASLAPGWPQRESKREREAGSFFITKGERSMPQIPGRLVHKR